MCGEEQIDEDPDEENAAFPESRLAAKTGRWGKGLRVKEKGRMH